MKTIPDGWNGRGRYVFNTISAAKIRENLPADIELCCVDCARPVARDDLTATWVIVPDGDMAVVCSGVHTKGGAA